MQFLPNALSKHPLPTQRSRGSSLIYVSLFVRCIGPSICVPVCIVADKWKLLNPSNARSFTFLRCGGSSPGYTGNASVKGIDKSKIVCIVTVLSSDINTRRSGFVLNGAFILRAFFRFYSFVISPPQCFARCAENALGQLLYNKIGQTPDEFRMVI